MIRLFNLAVVVTLIASAVGVYVIKYDATMQAEKIARISRDIAREEAAIAALRAEWANLTRPERLAALSLTHSTLKPMTIEQVIDLKDLPVRPKERDLIGEKLLGAADAGADPLITGSTNE